MKQNVLHLVSSFEQGGSERQAVRLARSLHESGRFGVRVAALDGYGSLRAEVEALDLQGKIEEFPLTSFYDQQTARQLARFVRFLKRERIDIVQTHDFYTNVFGITGARLAGVTARIAARRETSGVRTNRQRQVEHFVFRFAHRIVANAEAVRREVIAGGVPAHKVVTVYNGLEFDRLRTTTDSRESKRLVIEDWRRTGVFDSAHVTPDSSFVTIVANMRLRVKDHPTFIRMAHRVHEQVPDAAFVLAGEGELLEELRRFATEYGLAERTIFTDRCADVGALLAASDVCVLSSTGEGFSNSILEYMAASRPVVATDVGGAREAIIENETGYVVPAGDDRLMAERVVDLLKDSTRARAMGERGRRLVADKFSPQAQLARIENLYDELLSTKTADAHSEIREAI